MVSTSAHLESFSALTASPKIRALLAGIVTTDSVRPEFDAYWATQTELSEGLNLDATEFVPFISSRQARKQPFAVTSPAQQDYVLIIAQHGSGKTYLTSTLLDPPSQAHTIAAKEDLERLVRLYLQRASQLPQVEEIFIESEAAEPEIWTLISAPPFDSTYRSPVYEAERWALANLDRPVADFRLLNLKEVKGDLADILPVERRTVFRRNRLQ